MNVLGRVLVHEDQAYRRGAERPCSEAAREKSLGLAERAEEELPVLRLQPPSAADYDGHADSNAGAESKEGELF